MLVISGTPNSKIEPKKVLRFRSPYGRAIPVTSLCMLQQPNCPWLAYCPKQTYKTTQPRTSCHTSICKYISIRMYRYMFYSLPTQDIMPYVYMKIHFYADVCTYVWANQQNYPTQENMSRCTYMFICIKLSLTNM